MIEMEIMDTEDAGNNEVLFTLRMNNCSWATGYGGKKMYSKIIRWIKK